MYQSVVVFLALMASRTWPIQNDPIIIHNPRDRVKSIRLKRPKRCRRSASVCRGHVLLVANNRAKTDECDFQKKLRRRQMFGMLKLNINLYACLSFRAVFVF
jgi:hypothetical protein